MTEPLATAAYRRIRDRALSGALAPGAQLTERALAEDLGVSRTPLRAALARLEREGILTRLSGGAVLLREFTLERLIDSLDLRRRLEAVAAERAAGFGPTPELEAQAALMAGFAAGAPASLGFHDEDRAFHLALAQAGRLPLLAELLEEQLTIARLGRAGPGPEVIPQIAAEHLAITRAIAAGDPAAAGRAVEQHLSAARARCLARLAVRA